MSMSDEEIRAVLRTYQKDTVWYKRDIKGGRAVAEGIIFTRFAGNAEPYLYNENTLFDASEKEGEKPKLKKKLYMITIGIDFGGNGSITTFAAAGYFNRYHDIRIMEESGIEKSQDIDADKICEEFIKFYRMIIDKYEIYPDWIFPDSAATTMINSLRSAAKKAGLPWRNIVGCHKNEVSERPRMVDILFNTGRLKINRKCKRIISAVKALKWDEKKPNQPEDKNIGNCNDWWDACCYTMLDFEQYITLDR